MSTDQNLGATSSDDAQAPDADARTPRVGRRRKVRLFLGSLALRSLRDSGYTIEGALGEPVDNSIESGANRIAVKIEEGITESGKKGVTRIVIADDGAGMEEAVLRRYLQIGFSTRYMSDQTIGKYGVGAKLAALSVAKRVEVWSRARDNDPWRRVVLDLDEIGGDDPDARENEDVSVDEPDLAPFPEGVVPIDPKGTGTVVVWSKVDRLDEGRRARDTPRLRSDIEKELARIFRYFLDGGIKISVNGHDLLPYDPLFLMEGTWSDVVLTKELGPKDTKAEGKPETLHFGAEVLADENITVGRSTARLRVTLYPREVLRRRFLGGDELAQKLRIPGTEGVISFVRQNREINYTVVPRIFPAGIREFDRFIGVEVLFKPDLDLHFGVRNVKRGVEPDEQLRDEIRTRLALYIKTARRRLKEAWTDADAPDQQGEHDPIVNAAADVDRTLTKGRVEGPSDPREVEEALADLARDAGKDTTTEERDEYIERVRKMPFAIVSVDFPGNNFIDLEHLRGQVLIRLNTRHRFYRELWAPLKRVAEAPEGTLSPEEVSDVGRRAVEALTLMVLAYAKAETMHEDPHTQYGDLRDEWGRFLNQLLGKVKDVL